MKLIFIAAFVALAAAAPRPQEEVEHVAIISDESEPIDGHTFRREFVAANDISQSVVGSADENGGQVMSGSYSYPLDDGSVATFNWVADTAGYRVESPLLPVAPVAEHPIPAHALEQIAFRDSQIAAGLVWDESVQAWV